MRNVVFLLASLAALAWTSTANAIPVDMCQGKLSACFPTVDTTDLESVHFLGETGTTVHGETTTTNLLVEFNSSESLNTANGAAILTATDGGFTDLSFGMDNPALGMEIIEFSLRSQGGNTYDFLISDDQGGATAYQFAVGSGEQWFSIIADPDLPTQVAINSTFDAEIASFKHLKLDPDIVGNPDPVSVSASGSLGLLAMGLCGLVMARIRA